MLYVANRMPDGFLMLRAVHDEAQEATISAVSDYADCLIVRSTDIHAPGDRMAPDAPGMMVVRDRAKPAVIAVFRSDMFRRCREDESTGLDEAGAIMEALSQASPKLQAIFNSAITFRSDAPEWPVLYSEAVRLFGTQRANELLAPSEGA